MAFVVDRRRGSRRLIVIVNVALMHVKMSRRWNFCGVRMVTATAHGKVVQHGQAGNQWHCGTHESSSSLFHRPSRGEQRQG